MSSVQPSLLSLPTELRHAIYSYLVPEEVHIRLRQGGLSIAPCLGFKQYEVDRELSELLYSKDTGEYELVTQVPIEVRARRLQSKWSTHWRCEEHAMHVKDGHMFSLALLLICKSLSVAISSRG